MTSEMKARREAKREGDRLVYNKNLARAWREKKVCLQCIYSEDKADKFGSHEEFAQKFGVGRTPFGDNCYEVISLKKPENKEPEKEEPVKQGPVKQDGVHSAWNEKGTANGNISESPEKEQTPDEVFNELGELLAEEVALCQERVKREYRLFILALTDVFDRNLEFALGSFSSGAKNTITDEQAARWLSSLENMMRELGDMSKKFPKDPAEKYIIFREMRDLVNPSGRAFMDKHIVQVAAMIGHKMLKLLKALYGDQ